MKPFERWSLWVTTLLTGVSGIAYFWVKYFMEPAGPWAVINHPVQPWLLKIHIVSAPLMVFAVGLVALGHIWRHFRAGVLWGRRSGLTAMLSLAPMVLTGYLIQAVTHEGWLAALAWSHIGFGFLYLLGFVLHARVFRGPPPNGAGVGPEGGARGRARERRGVRPGRPEESPDGVERRARPNRGGRKRSGGGTEGRGSPAGAGAREG